MTTRPETPDPDPLGPDDDATIVARPDDDPTVVVPRREAAPTDPVPDDDATALVARDDDATVALDRPATADDATVPVARDVDATVPVRRDDGDDDATVPVVRDDDATRLRRRDARNARRAHSADSPSAVRDDATRARPREQPVMAPPRKRRRGELHPAPVPSGYGERAVRASGAGAVSTYRARAIPQPPAAGRPLAPTATVDRITEGAPSVTRQSRRFAALAITGFAASCVIAVVGLALIARTAFGL